MKKLATFVFCLGIIMPFTAVAQFPNLDQSNLDQLGFQGSVQDLSNINPIEMAQSAAAKQNFNVKSTPQFPEPFTETELFVDAYTIDTTGARIVWIVDGVEQTASLNDRSLNLTTKDVGEETIIEVQLHLRTGQILTKTIKINPARVDLIMEAKTTVPNFYQGRALPSVGSTVRIIAVPNNGTAARPKSFSYVWKHDGKVLFGGSVKGKNVAEITMGVGRNQLVTVDVIGNNGINLARKSIYVPMTKPEVVFYEDNPLRGASEHALYSPYMLTGEEVTLRAEPYYMSRNILTSDHLLEWNLNNAKIDNPSSDPQYITLRRQAGVGSAILGFHIRNLAQLVQGVEGKLEINF